MYAVIQTGGKQYRVAPGEMVQVEKLTAEVGTTVEFTEVLLVADDEEVRVGQPHVDGAKVMAEVVEQGRADKILVYKYRRRKGWHRKAGHRQPFTALKVTDITG